MENTIRCIVVSALGNNSFSFEEIKGGGVMNIVYKISFNDTTYILRMMQGEEYLAVYQKEQWCSDAAINAGIKTPKYITAGEMDGYAFSFQENVEGVQGIKVPHETQRIWFALGEYAEKYNQIQAPIFKIDYRDTVEKLLSSDLVTKLSLFSKARIGHIEKRLSSIYSRDFEPRLCHGNLHPSNVIVQPSGAMCLIDWGAASGNYVPCAELVELFTWNTGKENIRYFCDGYGITMQNLHDMMYDIQTLVLLRLLRVLRSKIERGGAAKASEFVLSTTKSINEIINFEGEILFLKNV